MAQRTADRLSESGFGRDESRPLVESVKTPLVESMKTWLEQQLARLAAVWQQLDEIREDHSRQMGTRQGLGRQRQ